MSSYRHFAFPRHRFSFFSTRLCFINRQPLTAAHISGTDLPPPTKIGSDNVLPEPQFPKNGLSATITALLNGTEPPTLPEPKEKVDAVQERPKSIEGITVEVLEEEVKDMVDFENSRWESQRETPMQTCVISSSQDPQKARALRILFEERKQALLKTCKEQGVPVVVFCFSNEDNPGGAEHDYTSRLNLFIPPLLKACEGQGINIERKETWGDKVTEVDYRNQEPFPSNFPGFAGYISRFPGAIVIDGYGKDAVEKWGFYLDNDLKRLLTVLLYTSSYQEYIETAITGSPVLWELENKGVKVTEKGAHSAVSPPAEYDHHKFKKLFSAFAESIARVRQGEKIALQAPNGYGKTTFLDVLESLIERSGRSIHFLKAEGDGNLHHIDACEVDIFGENKDFNRNRYFAFILKGVKDGDVVVIDEAGFANDQQSPAYKQIEAIIKKGARVLCVYPGNVTVPEERFDEVLRIGEPAKMEVENPA